MSRPLHLFISLGNSPAIVPRAFLLPGVEFAGVHVLTTERPDVSLVRTFFQQHAPAVELTITRVADFVDFTSEEDHFRFEEVMYRWFLDSRTKPDQRFVCLSGGFKTMSAAMQRAAAVLGAAEVFHVLADDCCTAPSGKRLPPSTIEEILQAKRDGHLHWIRLGPESGWPQFHSADATQYPLHLTKQEGCVRWATAPDQRFREHLREIVQRSHRIAGAWDRLPELPFAELATWAESDLAWLQEPLNPQEEADRRWVAALPKVELHCHLGGFATHGELLQQVRAAAEHPERLPPLEEPPPPPGWPLPAQPVTLTDYMRLGDANGSALLKDRGCLRKQCELLYRHLVEQNVLYAEIRCSPANYATAERSPWQVLEIIRDTFQRCMDASVAATFPVAEPGPATASVAGGPPPKDQTEASRPVAGPPHPSPAARCFRPFHKDAPYHQTWRDLPHRHQAGATAFVTFRLKDSLPVARLRAWHKEHQAFLKAHPKPWSESTWREYRRRFPSRLEDWLDEAHGACLLRPPMAAAAVEATLRQFDGTRYVLDEYVIMPNHVHALLKPLAPHTLTDILHSWKSYTAHAINRLLGRNGQLWEHESFDHLVRTREQLERLRRYIRENPAKAGLESGYRLGRGVGLIYEEEQKSPPAGVAASVAATASVAEPGPATASVAAAGSATSPGLGASSATSQRLVATSPSRGTLAATRPCHVNLILIATRRQHGDYRAAISRHLALAVTAAEHWTDPNACRVVGVDLAGYEDVHTRAHYFREEFTAVHRCGLALTVHAGENDDAEGIWRAVFDLNARRLGHALSLAQSPELLRSVTDRGIGLELCPYANHQIKGFRLDRSDRSDRSEPSYPLLRYLRAGARVTVNTDNIGISGASLTDNLLLAARLCPGLTRLELLRLQRHAIETAFCSANQRLQLLSRFSKEIPKP